MRSRRPVSYLCRLPPGPWIALAILAVSPLPARAAPESASGADRAGTPPRAASPEVPPSGLRRLKPPPMTSWTERHDRFGNEEGTDERGRIWVYSPDAGVTYWSDGKVCPGRGGGKCQQ